MQDTKPRPDQPNEDEIDDSYILISPTHHERPVLKPGSGKVPESKEH